MTNIVVTGSLAFDLIMDFPGNFSDHIDPTKLHILNLSFLVETLKKEKGGTAGNIAYNLALLGTKPAILGVAGEDFESYSSFLSNVGVDTSNIKIIKDQVTSQAFIVTDKKDNQITAFYPGAMKEASGLNLARLNKKPNLVVISPNHPKAMINFVKQSNELKIPYMFDPGMQLPRLSDQDLLPGVKEAEILIGNDYEMGLLAEKCRVQSAKLVKLAKIVITTLGERGSLIQTGDQSIDIKPAKPEKVLDPTGAGDAYRAGFLSGFIKGLDLKTCGQIGSVAACYAIEKYGTTNHVFTISEFCQRYKENFGKNIYLSV